MTLNEFIAKLEELRSTHGGETRVVIQNPASGYWFYPDEPHVVEDKPSLKEDLGLQKAINIGF